MEARRICRKEQICSNCIGESRNLYEYYEVRVTGFLMAMAILLKQC